MYEKTKNFELKSNATNHRDKKTHKLNPYLPRYITNVPWYRNKNILNQNKESKNFNKNKVIDTVLEKDYLGHQRKNVDEIIDYSLSLPGNGINDLFEKKDSVLVRASSNFDSKKDRWYGVQNSEWESALKNWEKIKKNKKTTNLIDFQQDSDDTDFELELLELGLIDEDLKIPCKYNPYLKTSRDREDVPSYIFNVNSQNESAELFTYNPKTRLTKKRSSYFYNDDDQFIKQSNADNSANSLHDESNLPYKKMKLVLPNYTPSETELFKSKKSTNVTNELEIELAINPTFIHQKLKEHYDEKRKELEERKKNILRMYGDN